jgi:hypothetical protein
LRATQLPSTTAGSGLPVTFTSQTLSVCTVSGNVVSAIAVGTCTIPADQAGNARYSAAPTVTQGFAVTSASGSGSTTVPLPPWALALLAASLIATARVARAHSSLTIGPSGASS